MPELNTTVAAASPPAGGRSESEQPGQYLTFVVSGELFALGILAIKEIIEYAQLTSVPMTPDFVRGVMNLRGAVVPVLDLAVRFGRPANPVSKRTCIVIAEIAAGEERLTVGFVVDAVNAVVDISPAQIEPPPAFGINVRTDFIEGMGRINDRFVILLDANRVVALEEMLTLSGETSAATAAPVGIPS
jgi:purine-binding chemotaxis protein CheW